MTQFQLIVNSLPRDLSEFAFFLIVGFTAGSMGIIWLNPLLFLHKFYSILLLKLRFLKLIIFESETSLQN